MVQGDDSIRGDSHHIYPCIFLSHHVPSISQHLAPNTLSYHAVYSTSAQSTLTTCEASEIDDESHQHIILCDRNRFIDDKVQAPVTRLGLFHETGYPSRRSRISLSVRFHSLEPVGNGTTEGPCIRFCEPFPHKIWLLLRGASCLSLIATLRTEPMENSCSR